MGKEQLLRIVKYRNENKQREELLGMYNQHIILDFEMNPVAKNSKKQGNSYIERSSRLGRQKLMRREK